MSDKRYMTGSFYGLDKRERIRDGAFGEYMNMTADGYPVAKTRDKRFVLKQAGEEEPLINGAVTSAVQNYIPGLGESIVTAMQSGSYVHINASGDNDDTDVSFRGDEQTVLNFGKDTFCYPEMKYIHWNEDKTATVENTAESVTGFSYENDPETEGYLLLWPNENQQAFEMFMGKIKVGDAIRLSGAGPYVNGGHIVQKKNIDNGYIQIDGSTPSDHRISVADGVIERRAPRFDFAVEHRNRIWGCRYGTNDDDEFVNEIYGSALGDPLNYFLYEGTAADSFTASVGTGGRWSGIGVIEDYVIFFKEDRYYILSGTEPPFTLREIRAEGVQIGSHRSICNIGGYLYYKSNHGIMRMSTDSLPACISEELGRDEYYKAIAGTDGRKYIVQMDKKYLTDITLPYERETYIYDTRTGLWTQEKNVEFELAGFVKKENELLAIGYHTEVRRIQPEEIDVTAYFLDGAYVGSVYWEVYGTLSAAGVTMATKTEEDFAWICETGTLGLDNPDYKEVKELLIRCKTAENTVVSVYIEYNGDGIWEKVFSEKFRQKGTKSISLSPPVQCDTYKLRIEGTGEFILYSITQTVGDGGRQNIVML